MRWILCIVFLPSVSWAALPSTGYQLLTVTNPSSALTDFTLLVDLSDMDASWWSAVDTSDGTKGRAAIHSSETELACDWIDFDNTGETGLLRVLWDGTLATSGTQQLRVYPPVSGSDSVAADDTYGSDNAYDAYWKGYWPDCGVDRTSSGNDGSANGGVTIGGTSGLIGAATDFDGSDDYVSISFTHAASTSYTWIACADADAVAQRWIFSGNTLSGGMGFGSFDSFNSNGVFRVYAGATATTRWIGSSGQVTTAWTQYVAQYDASSVSGVYINAVSKTPSSDNSASPVTSSTSLHIGGQPDSWWTRWDGSINEVSVHSTLRTAEWVAEEYAQVSDNSSFYTASSWVAGGSAVPIFLNHYMRRR